MADALVQLAEHHTLSLLAARFLDAALGTGRNLLFTGPLSGCLPVMAALVAQSESPGVFSAAVHRPQQGEAEPLPAAHPDRLAAWQQGPEGVAEALLQHVGVVAHLPAGRLDRCLMRLELALAKGTATPPLAVLAALDVVVVVTPTGDGRSRVSEIYEIVMAEDGYRPAPLFLAAPTPAGEALVPQRAPSFLPALRATGQGALAAELAAAEVPASAAPGPQFRAPPAPEPSDIPRPRAPARAAAAPKPASAPGWELDQDDALAPELPQGALVFADLLAEAHDDQPDMEADDSVGLEPPPRPKVNEAP